MKLAESPRNTIAQRNRAANGWKIGVIVVGLIILAGLGAIIQYNRNRDVYARLGNVVISKAEYSDALQMYQSYGEKTKQTNITSNVAAYTKSQVSLDIGLRNQADKNNISYSQDVINNYMIAQNPGLAQLTSVPIATRVQSNRSLLKSQYNWDDAAIDRNFRIAYLKEKLKSKLIAYRDVLQVMTRWDYAEGTTGITAADADVRAKTAITNKMLPLFTRKTSTDQIIQAADSVTGREVPLAQFSPSTTLAMVHKDLSLDNSNGVGFQDNTEWKAIYNLKKVGDYTSVTRSEAGYYYIDRLEAVSQGHYKTWDDFESQTVKAVSYYTSGFDWRRLVPNFGSIQTGFSVGRAVQSASALCVLPKHTSLKDKVMRIVLGAQAAEACPGGLGIQHTFTFGGTVFNNLLQPQSGVAVTIVNRGDLPVCGAAGTVEDYFVPGGTDSNGNWQTGHWAGNPFQGPATLDGRGFSCFMHWDAIFTIGTCSFRQPIGTPTGYNGMDIRFITGLPCGGDLPAAAIYYKIDDTGGANGNAYVNSRVNSDRYAFGIYNGNVYNTAGKQYDYYSLGTTNPALSYSFLVDSVPAGWSISSLESCANFANCTLAGYPNGGQFSSSSGATRYFAIHFNYTNPNPFVKIKAANKDISDPDVSRFLARHPNSGNPLVVDQDTPLTLQIESGNVRSCRASGSWNGSKGANATLRFNQNADTHVAPRTLAYTITCRAASGLPDPSPDTVYVQVNPVIQYPWLQTVNGDVLAFGAITGQGLNQAGSRQTSSPDKEATYVIIAALSPDAFDNKNFNIGSPGAVAINSFCSTNSNRSNNYYALGHRDGQPDSVETPCTSGVYVPYIPDEFFNPTNAKTGDSGDEVVSNIQLAIKVITDPNNSSIVCTANKPYKYGGMVDTVTSSLGGVFNDSALGDCPEIYELAGLNLGNPGGGGEITNRRGRATIYVDGNLRIRNNIVNNFLAHYYSVNDVPNLGIVVNGNVEIDNSVTRIDAAIYARGHIFTCDSGSYGVSAGNHYDRCRNQLVVHGALAAKGGFIFGRAYANDANQPAEQIITNGTFLNYPPPGFEERYTENIRRLFSAGENPPSFSSGD